MAELTHPGADLCVNGYCLHSLAPATGPGSIATPLGNGDFLSQADAHMKCVNLGYEGLAVLTTYDRQVAAASIVDTTALPHWLGAHDWGEPPGGRVVWDSLGDHESGGSAELVHQNPMAAHDDKKYYPAPWHVPTNQPNDCDGPHTELCIFMGPGGAWFDFHCQPKIPREEMDLGEGHELIHKITPGPEIEWILDSGIKIEYNVHPLCGINLLMKQKNKNKNVKNVEAAVETGSTVDL